MVTENNALFLTQCEDRGIDHLDALYVSGGRWWSMVCENPECCPPEGTVWDDSAALQLAAEFVAKGSIAPAESRLEASVPLLQKAAATAPGCVTDLDTEAAEAEMSMAALISRWGEKPPPGIQPAEVADHVQNWLAGVMVSGVEAYGDNPSAMTTEDMAELLAPLRVLHVRDWVLIQCMGGDGDRWGNMLRWLGTNTRVKLTAQALAIVGVWHYLKGNGFLGSIAADRALEIDPECTLATLLLHCIVNALPPDELREALTKAHEALNVTPIAERITA